MAKTDAVARFEAQGKLQPGDEGYWKVWGARPRHIRAGDIVMSKNDGDDSVETYEVEELFLAKAHPMRIGLVVKGERTTIGALCPIVLVRWGTHNMLASP